MRWPWTRLPRGTDGIDVPESSTSGASRAEGVPLFDIQHLAIIMDGNGRWAQQKHLPRIEGHRAGAKTVRMVVEESRRLGIKYLTLFSFSTENWLRPQEEVSGLMRLFCEYVQSERGLLLNNQIRLRAIGARDRLPSDVQRALESIERETADLTGMQLVLALSYGGRDEIARGARAIAEACMRGDLTPAQIDEQSFRDYLFAPDIPDPDLLLRTGDEFRVSNFLLWQVAYAEFVVTKSYWPALTKEEFHRCLQEYASRVRRFGLTDEQIRSAAGNGPNGEATGTSKNGHSSLSSSRQSDSERIPEVTSAPDSGKLHVR